ncbi:MAG TPA: DUF6328 family protein [Thermoleophilaceae bacterium]|nr:DUF6328 family protein [Thermoleophilaceae bacterium]
MEAGSGRAETDEERLDRNLTELLAEMRVAITGVQVLFAFLLIVPFNDGFKDLNTLQRDLYLVSLLGAGAATVALVAPIAQHRVTFRLQDKHHIVHSANRFALIGLACLALSMTAAVTLVTSAVFGTATGLVTAAGTLLAFAGCWGVLPVSRRRAIR